MHRLTTGEIKAVAHNTFAHTLHCTSAVLDAISAPGPAISKSGIASTFNVSVVSCTI
jgi:phage tail protein X